jgi:hypothetical protein
VEQVDSAWLKKNRDAAFTQSVQLLVADVKTLLAPGANP